MILPILGEGGVNSRSLVGSNPTLSIRPHFDPKVTKLLTMKDFLNLTTKTWLINSKFYTIKYHHLICQESIYIEADGPKNAAEPDIMQFCLNQGWIRIDISHGLTGDENIIYIEGRKNAIEEIRPILKILLSKGWYVNMDAF